MDETAAVIGEGGLVRNGGGRDDISVTYEETLGCFHIGSHFHNTYELIYVVEGTVLAEINSRKYEASRGSIIFISHLESHQLQILQYPYKRYYLLVKPQLFQGMVADPRLSSIFRYRPGNFSHLITLDAAETDTVTSFFSRIKCELDSDLDFSLMGTTALMQLFFIHLYRLHRQCFPLADTSGPVGAVYQVQKYIDEHCLETLTLKDVSDLFYIDMYYLSRLFKKVCGFSFKEYLVLQRLSRAKDLLVETDASVTELCMSSGFSNVNHFIRIFKKNEGISPLQYRKKFAKGENQ